MRRSSPLLALWCLILSAPVPAWAGAGGGTSSYSGGGGGGYSGGGSSFSSGSSYSGGSSSGGSISTGRGWLDLLIVLAFIFFLCSGSILGGIRIRRYRAKRQDRAAKVAAAAAEAAEDDPVFAPAEVQRAAADLYLACQNAWSANDRKRLAVLVGGDLLVEWNRRLDDFDRKGWHNKVHVHTRPGVEYLGLVNREGEAADRVVVRISATQEDYVQTRDGDRTKDGSGSNTVQVEEWWTMARRDGRWIVVSIEQDAEGMHNLDTSIVARPDADDERLHDESTVEVAQDDAPLAGFKTADIADLDFDGDARAAAMDLSLADARFAPDVLEVAVRRAVSGWAEAVDGADGALLAVAAPEVAQKLLYPTGNEDERVVVRGPQVKHVRITALDAAADPARMSVEVDVNGRRYVENRDTVALVSGSKDDATDFTEHWTLAIDGPQENPWRIVSAQ